MRGGQVEQRRSERKKERGRERQWRMERNE